MKITIIIVVILAIVIGLYAFSKRVPKDTLEKGDTVPKFELKDQNGQLFKVADFIGKKNLVIYFSS